MHAAALLPSTASSRAVSKRLGVSGSRVGHDVHGRAQDEQGAEAREGVGHEGDHSATGTQLERRVSEAEGTQAGAYTGVGSPASASQP